MLINHRQSAYVDNEELERAAGMLEIRAKTAEHNVESYAAAAMALRILQTQDLKEAKDFVLLFECSALGPVANPTASK